VRKAPEIPQAVFETADVFFEEPQPVTRKTARRQAGKQSKRQKVQITIYLTDEAAKNLERARFELLTEYDLKVPKSEIAEYALARALADISGLAEGLRGNQAEG
jgi:hypothetical protein